MSFNPKGQYYQFNSQGRREVYVQAGQLYNSKNENLYDQFARDKSRFDEDDYRRNWTFIDWMNYNSYAMNTELRDIMVDQQVAEMQKAELEEVHAKANALRSELREKSERELYKHRQEVEAHLLPPVVPNANLEPIKPAFLTSVEKKLFGVEEPATSSAPKDPFEGIDLDKGDPVDWGEAAPAAAVAMPTTVRAKVRK